MEKQKILGYFGHHKCASNWLSRHIVKSVADKINLKYEHYGNPRAFNHELKNTLAHKGIEFFAYTNANIDYIKDIIADIKGFHVIRDPRDICVSAYFSHLHSHPVKGKYSDNIREMRQRLNSLSMKEGLFIEMDFLESIFSHLDKWNYSLSNILEIKFENLIQAANQTILAIFEFLNLISEDPEKEEKKISFLELHKIIDSKRFENMTAGRNPGEENVKSHFRKGISGDWQNFFNKKHKEYFKLKYNNLLLKLKYEKDKNW